MPESVQDRAIRLVIPALAAVVRRPAAREEAEARRRSPPEQTGRSQGTADGKTEARERVWKVGDAGEVAVRFRDRGLSLVDARPNEGWEAHVEESASNEIEVRFSGADEVWGFEATVEGDRLEVETRHEMQPAPQAGTYRVGHVGAVKIRQQGGDMALVRTWSDGGWSVDVVQENAEEVEAEFDRHDERWRFEAETDDGRLRVTLAHRIADPLRR